KVDGDRATLEDTPEEKHVGGGLRKVDGVWKMSMGDIIQGQPEARVNQMLVMIDKQTELQKQAKKELEENKYASASDLRDGMMQKMQTLLREAAAMQAASAPTPAATAPSGASK